MGSDQSVQHRVATPLLQLPGQLRGEREVARPGEGRPMFYHSVRQCWKRDHAEGGEGTEGKGLARGNDAGGSFFMATSEQNRKFL